jgi:hypothetical protein
MILDWHLDILLAGHEADLQEAPSVSMDAGQCGAVVQERMLGTWAFEEQAEAHIDSFAELRQHSELEGC